MSKTNKKQINIFKYIMCLGRGVHNIKLPKNTVLLDLQIQDGKIALWAEVDFNEKEMVPVGFNVYYTGDQVSDASYLKTLVDERGIVYHVYKQD